VAVVGGVWHRSRGCWRVSDAALRGIDFGPGRWHRRGASPRGHRDVVVANIAAALLPPPLRRRGRRQRTRERGEPPDVRSLADDRSLAAPPTNGVVAVPLDARRRRRRRRLRARTRRVASRRADTGGRADTH